MLNVSISMRKSIRFMTKIVFSVLWHGRDCVISNLMAYIPVADRRFQVAHNINASVYYGERSGSVVECLTRDRRDAGFEPHRRHCVVSLSKKIYPSLVLVQPRKTRPFITERLLMGRKESNQTKIQCIMGIKHDFLCIKICWTPKVVLKPKPQDEDFNNRS